MYGFIVFLIISIGFRYMGYYFITVTVYVSFEAVAIESWVEAHQPLQQGHGGGMPPIPSYVVSRQSLVSSI